MHELSGVIRHIHTYTAASFSVHVCVDSALEDINIMYSIFVPLSDLTSFSSTQNHTRAFYVFYLFAYSHERNVFPSFVTRFLSGGWLHSRRHCR